MEKHPDDREIILGEVGVDSGQLMICDPSYIDGQWVNPPDDHRDFAHEIYRHTGDGKMWQFTYNGEACSEGVRPFPGTYETVIPDYGKTPNAMIKSGEFVRAEHMDHRAHIPNGEFSYRNICKQNEKFGAQMNYKLGHPGVAVAFRSGLGDGCYRVRAIVGPVEGRGERVKQVIIDLID